MVPAEPEARSVASQPRAEAAPKRDGRGRPKGYYGNADFRNYLRSRPVPLDSDLAPMKVGPIDVDRFVEEHRQVHAIVNPEQQVGTALQWPDLQLTVNS